MGQSIDQNARQLCFPALWPTPAPRSWICLCPFKIYSSYIVLQDLQMQDKRLMDLMSLNTKQKPP